ESDPSTLDAEYFPPRREVFLNGKMSDPQNRFGFVLPRMSRFGAVGAKSCVLAAQRHARRTTTQGVAKASHLDGTLHATRKINAFNSINAHQHAYPQSRTVKDFA